MTSSGRNYDYDTGFQRPHRDSMRTGYVLVSEERESGSEYSGSTCCCSSCASSCSGSESSDEDDDAYLSDCSACWARRDALRRGRAGWREGEGGDSGSGRRGEARDQVRQDYHHHHRRHGQHRHGETRQRGQQNSGHSSRSNNTNNASTNNTNTYATPAFRSLTERILATTRRLHQDEENLRHFRTWIRVLEDIQRQPPANPSNGNGDSSAAPAVAAVAAAAAAARTRQGSSAAAAVGRASDVPPRGGEAAMRRAQAYPQEGRGYFMSGGRSISTNRRRRL